MSLAKDGIMVVLSSPSGAGKTTLVKKISFVSPDNKMNESTAFSINSLSRTRSLLYSLTMVCVLRRHVCENNPDQPIDHDEEDGGERQASS